MNRRPTGSLLSFVLGLGVALGGCAEAHVGLEDAGLDLGADGGDAAPTNDGDVGAGGQDAAPYDEGVVDDAGRLDEGPRPDAGPLDCESIVANRYFEPNVDPNGTITVVPDVQVACSMLGVVVSEAEAIELASLPGITCVEVYFVGHVCIDTYTVWQNRSVSSLNDLCWLDAVADGPEWACVLFPE